MCAVPGNEYPQRRYKALCCHNGIWCFSLLIKYKIPTNRVCITNSILSLLDTSHLVTTCLNSLRTRSLLLPRPVPPHSALGWRLWRTRACGLKATLEATGGNTCSKASQTPSLAHPESKSSPSCHGCWTPCVRILTRIQEFCALSSSNVDYSSI